MYWKEGSVHIVPALPLDDPRPKQEKGDQHMQESLAT
jgi:hypothetical protein